MRRICHMVTPSLLLTGFGVPNSTDREIRVILTLTPCPPRHSQPRIRSLSTFQSTFTFPLEV